MNRLKPALMTTISVPVTWSGVEGVLHGASTVVGFLTGLTGLGIGIYGLLWWRRKFNRDKQNKEE